MTNILQRFAERFGIHQVEVILIGGWAAILHGSARTTVDIDFVYSRSPENLQRIVDALADLDPYLRGAPPGLPFLWDVQTVASGLNFTLTTSQGDIDLLGDIPGGGTYQEILPFTEQVVIAEVTLRCVTLDCLIQLKQASGRPKDLEAIAELQRLRENR
jgi:hypothetical protein